MFCKGDNSFCQFVMSHCNDDVKFLSFPRWFLFVSYFDGVNLSSMIVSDYIAIVW